MLSAPVSGRPSLEGAMIHGFILHQRAVRWELPQGLGLVPFTVVSPELKQ